MRSYFEVKDSDIEEDSIWWEIALIATSAALVVILPFCVR